MSHLKYETRDSQNNKLADYSESVDEIHPPYQQQLHTLSAFHDLST